MMALLLVAVAWAQDIEATISPEAVTWLAGLTAAGVGLTGIGAGAYALYKFFLRPSVLEDVQAIIAPLAAQLQRLEAADAEMQRITLETWGTKERGLLADLLRLADADIVRRVESLEAHRENSDQARADHYGEISQTLEHLKAMLEHR